MTIRLVPATMSTAWIACALFGSARVISCDWMSPVKVIDVTDDEYAAARDLCAEIGVTVERE